MKFLTSRFFALIFPFSLLAMFLASCSPAIHMETDVALISPKIVFSKGACYGDCPVYNLTIYNTGLMKFNGVRSTQMLGKYEKQLTETEYIQLVKNCRRANLWKLDDNYDMNIADLPTTTLSFSDKEKQKTIKSKRGFPSPVDSLEKQLLNLIRQDGWNQTDFVAPPPQPKNEVIIKNELIIKGTDQLILVRWLKEYADYEMKIVRRLGPESPLWLVTFNQDKIDPDEMIKKVKEDPSIESVEFNKKVSNRE